MFNDQNECSLRCRNKVDLPPLDNSTVAKNHFQHKLQLIQREVIFSVCSHLWGGGTPSQVWMVGGRGWRYHIPGQDGGVSHPRSRWGVPGPGLDGGGYPIPGLDRGGTPSQVWIGGYPSQFWMGVPHPADRGTPIQDQDGGYSGVPPLI